MKNNKIYVANHNDGSNSCPILASDSLDGIKELCLEYYKKNDRNNIHFFIKIDEYENGYPTEKYYYFECIETDKVCIFEILFSENKTVIEKYNFYNFSFNKKITKKL